MDLSFKHFVLLLFAATIAAVFLLKPHRIDVVSKKGVPQVQFIDFDSYEITKAGVDAWLKGALGEKYGPKMHIRKLKLKRRSAAGTEYVTASEALLDDHRSIQLEKKVYLTRSDGWKFVTQRLRYDMKKRIYSTQNLPFVAYYGRSVLHGTNLRYMEKSGKIMAQKIHAKLYEEDR